MLPLAVASLLLFVSGVWWTASILLSLFWERRFETPDHQAERTRQREGAQDRASVVGAVMFIIPTVVTLGLALDGISETRVIFYASGWSWFLPEAAAFQVLGAVLVFVGLPLMTSTVYLIERHVYSRLPTERVLIQRGPYAFIRHPMHLAASLLAIGWVLLAQNFVALVLLFLLDGIIVARKEEAELIEVYGDAYRAYRRRTGFFFPRWRKAA